MEAVSDFSVLEGQPQIPSVPMTSDFFFKEKLISDDVNLMILHFDVKSLN